MSLISAKICAPLRMKIIPFDLMNHDQVRRLRIVCPVRPHGPCVQLSVSPFRSSHSKHLAHREGGRDCRFDDCGDGCYFIHMSLSDLKIQLRGACRHHSVRRLQVFGSVSRGLETSDSDVDFLVQFQDMPPGEYARHYFALLHGLEEILLVGQSI